MNVHFKEWHEPSDFKAWGILNTAGNIPCEYEWFGRCLLFVAKTVIIDEDLLNQDKLETARRL